MVAKSDVKLEVFPIEYFHQLALRLEGKVDLVALSRDSRIIAFGWCLEDTSTYHMMYAGIDYTLNHEFDLYFNLMYAGFDRALRKRSAEDSLRADRNGLQGENGLSLRAPLCVCKGARAIDVECLSLWCEIHSHSKAVESSIEHIQEWGE